jgi:hypothetical protein
MKFSLLLAALALAGVRSAPFTDEVATAATDIYNAVYKARVGDGPAPTLPCLLGNCAGKIAACMLDKSCRDGMLCTKGCAGTNQTCIFQCTSDFENEVYDNMIKCFFTDHDCMKMPKGQTFDTYGACKSVDKTTTLAEYLGKPLTVEKTKTLVTRNGKDQGYWLVARGLSHAYDCFDCQNLYFNVGGPSQPVATNASDLAYTAIYKIHKSDGTFRWNVAEYLAEFDMFPQPGRMHLHAPDYGGLVHDEDWRVLAVDERTEDDPQWLALYYCGGAPGVKETYEGSCVLTPDGLMPSSPSEAKKIEDAYAKAGITLACVPNNTAAACKGHPNPPAAVGAIEAPAQKPCCQGVCTTAGLQKYWSIAKGIFGEQHCGECCMDPSKYKTYHFFEKNLTKSDSDTPCHDFGYTKYDTTTTHGFGPIKMTLDLYDKP